jgi:hypothetical protein
VKLWTLSETVDSHGFAMRDSTASQRVLLRDYVFFGFRFLALLDLLLARRGNH